MTQRFLTPLLVSEGPDHDGDTLLPANVMVILSLLISVAGAIWGLLYIALDEPVAGAIPLSYSVLSWISIAAFLITRRYALFRASQLVLILLLPFLLQVALGGFVPASAVILWSLLAPFGALLVAGRRAALGLFAAFAVLVVTAQIVQPSLQIENNLSSAVIGAFFVMNILGVSLIAFVTLYYFVALRDRAMQLLGEEQERSERLLLNVLPREIAAELKEGHHTIARHYPEASVLFADIVGFTPMTLQLGPDELIALLNEVFSEFDALMEAYGCEKIRTIGDNYMAAAGVPTPRPDHAKILARAALEMNGHAVAGNGLTFRLGIASGPLVAGVIGTSKFQYDIWGDTVNTASRMESHGVSGRIQITEATYELLRDEFDCTPRGTIEVKGKGEMRTWFLEGPAPEAPSVDGSAD